MGRSFQLPRLMSWIEAEEIARGYGTARNRSIAIRTIGPKKMLSRTILVSSSPAVESPTGSGGSMSKERGTSSERATQPLSLRCSTAVCSSARGPPRSGRHWKSGGLRFHFRRHGRNDGDGRDSNPLTPATG